MTKPITKNQYKNLWFEEFFNMEKQLCGLCGNTGFIDTRGKAISYAGVECGIKAHCICPNGRLYKKGGV